MIKHDYGHMGCPFYEEKLDNQLTVIFLPKKTEVKSATIYISQGGFLHAKEISSSKIPFGSAYYTMNMIASSSLKESLKKDGCLLDSDLDYSYVRYSLNTLDDIYKPLKKLMDRITKPCFEEKDIEAFKEKEKVLDKKRNMDPIYVSQRECLKDLYMSSPIQYGYIPSFEDGVRIHASTLKKYQETYYSPDHIVIFLSLDDNIEHVLEEVKRFHFSTSSKLKETKFEYEEVYDKVEREYKEIEMETKHSYLTYGIKLPSREIIYDNYGELTFCAYEIFLSNIIYGNHEFNDHLNSLKTYLVDATLKEGGEDGYILLTFQTEDEISLINYLTSYFAKLGDKVSSSSFGALVKDIYAKAIREVALPNKALDHFSKSYPNHIPYTMLMKRIYHLSFSSYRRFLEEFKSFKKSVCFVKRKESYAR